MGKMKTARVVVSASSLSRQQPCIRAYALRHRARLKLDSTSPAMCIGSGVHGALAAFYQGESNEICLEQGEAETLRSDPLATPESLAETERVSRWYLKNAKYYDEEIELVSLAVEQRFTIQLVEDCYMVGVLDMLAQTRFGLTLIDHKTGARGGASYFKGYEKDGQAIAYPYACRVAAAQSPDSFMVSLIKKTKTPAIERQAFPVYWPLVEQAMKTLGDFLVKYLQPLSDNPVDVLAEVPGNTMACRFCAYQTLCHASEREQAAALQFYTVADYTSFGLE